MKQIAIGQNLAYAAKAGGGTIAGINEINLLDTGAIAVFTEFNELVTVANSGTILDDRRRFYIAVGNQATESKTMITSMIQRDFGTSYTKKAYIAPVLQVKFIGYDGAIGAFNFPGTLVVGTEAFVKLTNTTRGLRTLGSVYENEIKRYSTDVRTGDTNTTIANRLIAQINADPDRFVNALAVGATTGIQLTAIGFGTTFDIALDGIAINSTIEEAEGTTPGNGVAPNYGSGTYDQVRSIEDVYSVERGNTNRTHLSQYYYKIPSLAVSGKTYNLYTISFSGVRKGAVEMQFTANFDIVTALPTDGTNPITAFETIMAAAFNLSANPPETGA